MSLSFVVDMNLSADWVAFLQQNGYSATHWSAVGDPTALDPEIVEWARNHSHVVLTHDLDFGAILAHTQAAGPSVVLLRTGDTFPLAIGGAVLSAIQACEQDLISGALVLIELARHRIRILPI